MARVGVLAVQGAFERHAAVLRALQHDVVLVRAPSQLEGLDGLVLPGGESTVQLSLLERLDLERPLLSFATSGKPILATCAGTILLASQVTNPAQRSLGVVDIAVVRNAYGRQLDSFEAMSEDEHPRPLVFIRAPRIVRCGPTVETLARHKSEPVLVRERNIICATYHPELTTDQSVHEQTFGRGRLTSAQQRAAP